MAPSLGSHQQGLADGHRGRVLCSGVGRNTVGKGEEGGRFSATRPGQGAKDPTCRQKCILKHRIASQSKELDSQTSFPSRQGPRPQGPEARASDPCVCCFSLAPPLSTSCAGLAAPTAALSLNRKGSRRFLLRANRPALPALHRARSRVQPLLVARSEVSQAHSSWLTPRPGPSPAHVPGAHSRAS